MPMEPPQQPPMPKPPKFEPQTPPSQVKVVTPHLTPHQQNPTPTSVATLPPTPNAIEALPAPSAQPALPDQAPESPAASTPANAAPRVVGIGEIGCSPPKVTYPTQSRRMGETGKAVVSLTTDESGRVIKAAVATSSGSTRLDTAAINAVQAMRCKPYMESGRPVAATAQQPIDFELN